MQALLETISKNFSQNTTQIKNDATHDRARRNEAAYKQDTTGGRKMEQQKEKTTNAMKQQKEKATLVSIAYDTLTHPFWQRVDEQKEKMTFVITYNSVKGYEPGFYYGKKRPLLVCSYDNTSTCENEAQSKLESILQDTHVFMNPEDVERVYLYIGKYARDGALKAAERFSDQGNKLSLVACACESDIKQQTAKRIGAPIIWSECGGQYTLGEIVDGILRR